MEVALCWKDFFPTSPPPTPTPRQPGQGLHGTWAVWCASLGWGNVQNGGLWTLERVRQECRSPPSPVTLSHW